jgi:hypothetical protein
MVFNNPFLAENTYIYANNYLQNTCFYWYGRPLEITKILLNH